MSTPKRLLVFAAAALAACATPQPAGTPSPKFGEPVSAQQLAGTGFHEISGIAWSGAGRIRRVEVSTDGGQTWAEAALTGAERAKALVRFRHPWQWQGAAAVLQSRATDEKGTVQPARREWQARFAPDIRFHNNSIVSWGVETDGSVKNVYA